MHSTNFSQFGSKLFGATAKKLQSLRASRYWPDSPAKLWGSIGGAFLLLLIIMPFRDFLSLLVVVGALAGALTLWKPWEYTFFNSHNHPDSKVVDLNSYRQRKQQAEEPPNVVPGLQLVLETNFLPQADLVKALLEEHGIPVNLLNRHNASILVHPLGSQTVKVMVPASEHSRAIRLLEQNAPHSPDKGPNIA
ncbi:MAG: putative prokaryotic signal transducing protein [Pseudomonadota bacterium]